MQLSQSDRASMLQVISDLSKDAYGCRIRLDYEAMSDSELQFTWDGFIAESEASTQREAAQKLRAQKDWEAHIAQLMSIGASDRATAIRWDMVAMDAVHGTHEDGSPHYDVGYYCYLVGLDYALEASIEAELALKH